MTGHNTVGNKLQQHGFTRSGWRYDQTPLTKPDRRHEIHNACRIVIFVGFEIDLFIRIQRRQVIKKNFIPGNFRVFIVDGLNFQ
mgnify:CR=1 FL=1